MSKVLDLIAREPVRTAGVTLVVSAVVLFEVFGLVSLSTDQKTALAAFGLAVLGVLEAVRGNVSPNNDRYFDQDE